MTSFSDNVESRNPDTLPFGMFCVTATVQIIRDVSTKLKIELTYEPCAQPKELAMHAMFILAQF